MAIYLARLDGTRWTVLEESDVWPLGVSLSPSGEIWRAGASAVLPTWERFDGERWIPVDTGDAALAPPSIAADGTLWFLGPSGVYRVSMEGARP
jgi:streptogramin lyase